MNWAIVENNIITNIIIAKKSFIDEFYPNAINVDEVQCSIGWEYKNNIFISTDIKAPIIQSTESSDESL